MRKCVVKNMLSAEQEQMMEDCLCEYPNIKFGFDTGSDGGITSIVYHTENGIVRFATAYLAPNTYPVNMDYGYFTALDRLMAGEFVICGEELFNKLWV